MATTVLADQVEFRAGFNITNIVASSTNSWEVAGQVIDNSISGFSGFDVTTGILVACESPYGDIDVYRITNINSQAAAAINVQVVYDQGGTPRVGGPVYGQQALCNITATNSILLPPSKAGCDVSDYLYYGMFNESFKRVALIKSGNLPPNWIAVSNDAVTAYGWGNHATNGYITNAVLNGAAGSVTGATAYLVVVVPSTNGLAATNWVTLNFQGLTAWTNWLATNTHVTVETDPLWNIWRTNSAAGSTNAILPDGSLVDISALLGGSGTSTDTLQTVVNRGNSATNDIILSGNITLASNSAANLVAGYGASGAGKTYSISLGYEAGLTGVGDQNVYIGYDTGCSSVSTNSIFIGPYSGRNAIGKYRTYLDSYVSDPGADHNPSTDSIVIDGNTTNLYLGRPTGTVSLRGTVTGSASGLSGCPSGAVGTNDANYLGAVTSVVYVAGTGFSQTGRVVYLGTNGLGGGGSGTTWTGGVEANDTTVSNASPHSGVTESTRNGYIRLYATNTEVGVQAKNADAYSTTLWTDPNATVARYDFEGTAWSNDTSGNAYTLTDHGAGQVLIGTNNFGRTESAATFTKASSQYMDAGNVTAMNSVPAFTMATWAKFASSGEGYDVLLASKNQMDNNFRTVWGKSWRPWAPDLNDIALVVCNGGVAFAYTTDGATTNNVWWHLVVTFSGGTVVFYRNGQLVPSSVSGTMPSTTSSGAGPFQVGGETYNSRYMDGQIDAFKWYPIALSSSQVAVLYTNMGGAFGPTNNVESRPGDPGIVTNATYATLHNRTVPSTGGAATQTIGSNGDYTVIQGITTTINSNLNVLGSIQKGGTNGGTTNISVVVSGGATQTLHFVGGLYVP
jgi:hypothetical protein